MADKKLSAFDVLQQLSADDLVVVLQALGNSEFANKNIRFSSLQNLIVADSSGFAKFLNTLPPTITGILYAANEAAAATLSASNPTKLVFYPEA